MTRTGIEFMSVDAIATVIRRDATYIIIPANKPFLYLRSPDGSGGSRYMGYVIADVECRAFLDHYHSNVYSFTFVTDNPGNSTDGWNHFSEISTYNPLPPERATVPWRNYTYGPFDGKYYGWMSTGGRPLEDYSHLAIPIVGTGSRERTAEESYELTYGPNAVGPFWDGV